MLTGLELELSKWLGEGENLLEMEEEEWGKTVRRDQEQTVMREPMGSEGRWRLLGKSRVLALTVYYSSSFIKISFFLFFFLMWVILFFVFTDFVTILLLFYLFGFLAPRHMGS